MSTIDELVEFLATCPVGPIEKGTDLSAQVIKKLIKSWTEFGGIYHENTEHDDLNRAQEMTWNPPILTFVLDRHGGKARGSTRDELHYWEVDFEKRSAQIVKIGFDADEPAQPGLDCGALAKEIANGIQEGCQSPKWIWSDQNQTVTLRIGKIIPPGFKSTTIGRRKRFRLEFLPLMESYGWTFRPKGNVMSFTKLT